MKLSGTWRGEYTYGDGYVEDGVAGRSVPFTMSLTESWLRRFAGYVRDDASRGGQPERGRVLGKRRAQRVEFVKTMPKGYVNVDGELVEARQVLEEELGTEIDERDLPDHRIAYVGELDDSGEAMRGTWQIVTAGRRGLNVVLGGGDGTWTARRASDQPTEV